MCMWNVEKLGNLSEELETKLIICIDRCTHVNKMEKRRIAGPSIDLLVYLPVPSAADPDHTLPDPRHVSVRPSVCLCVLSVCITKLVLPKHSLQPQCVLLPCLFVCFSTHSL